MDFNKSNLGLVTPVSPKNGLPAEDAAPAGSDWDMEKMTIGPGKTIRPGSPNPMEVADWPSFELWMEELGRDAPEFRCPDGVAVDEEGRPELLPVLTDAASLASNLEELAPLLNWSVPACASYHQQTLLQYGERQVPVDKSLAPVLRALWAAGGRRQRR